MLPGKSQCKHGWCADAGELVPEDKQEQLDALIDDVERSPPPGSSRPIENPLIFGNYQVSYVSTRRAPRQEGQRTSSEPIRNLEVCMTSWNAGWHHC
jgi:hypothetical protein